MEMNKGAKKWMTVIVIVAILVVVIVIAVLAFGNHAAAPTATQNGNQQAATTAPSYTSSKDGFAVNFPGTPTVTTTMFNSMTAGSLPLTTYKEMASGTSSKAFYEVMVYHYPATYQFPDNYLAGALQVFGLAVNAKYSGTTIVDQTPTQFLGAPALFATITVPAEGTTNYDYVLLTTRGENTYIINTYGLSESDYNTFVGSFSFTQ